MALELEKLAMKDPQDNKKFRCRIRRRRIRGLYSKFKWYFKELQIIRLFAWSKCGCRKGRSEKYRRRILFKGIFFRSSSTWRDCCQSYHRSAWELLDPVMIKTQKAAVIFDPDVARSLIGGIITAINGERVLQGASFLKDYLE